MNCLQFTGCCNPFNSQGCVLVNFPISNAWFERSAQWCWLPYLSLHAPTRCKERLSGLWLGVFFIHSKCTTPSLSKKPTCWNFSVKAMLGQLVSTGLPPWKRTNLNGVHQGCRAPAFFTALATPQACHSREQTESVTHWQSQSAVVNHPPRRSQSPSAPPHWRREVTTLWRASIYIYNIICMFFFPQTCNMYVSFRHWLFRWLLIDISCLQLNIRFRVYSGLI